MVIGLLFKIRYIIIVLADHTYNLVVFTRIKVILYLLCLKDHTLSEPELASGNFMCTPPQSSMIDCINFPPAPMMVLWILAGIIRSQLTYELMI